MSGALYLKTSLLLDLDSQGNMATRRIPPPKPGTPVPKEYVRQQLNTLGIRNVTEEEIESYAAGKTIVCHK